MVLWLKSKPAADWPLQIGQLCLEEGLMAPSVREIFRTPSSSTVCYSCNTYGHTQTNCRRATRGGNCSGGHQTRDCTGTAALKCPACTGAHTIKDWCCKHHPAHKKYLAQITRMPEASQTVELLEAWLKDTVVGGSEMSK